MGKEVVEVAAKDEEGKEVEETEVEVQLQDDILKIIIYKGICSALGIHVFYYGQKSLADQMRTIWEKLVNNVITIHGHDISK